MRTMKIEKQGGHPNIFVNSKTEKIVKCAFDRERNCSPDCAACEMFGTDIKAQCNKNGTDNEFTIGRIEGA